jgi:hypothetical protein
VKKNQFTKFIVITGGPGAGKTAVLEMTKKMLIETTTILPEAASILFNGGFWRLSSLTSRAAAQKAIFHIQNEMENLVNDEEKWNLGLCDRGSLDGLAYWPYDETSFWEMCGTNLSNELSKYLAVIHLRTPSELQGYNHQNPLRTETAMNAKVIDDRIAEIWKNHPSYICIDSHEDFLIKAEIVISELLKYQHNVNKKSYNS